MGERATMLGASLDLVSEARAGCPWKLTMPARRSLPQHRPMPAVTPARRAYPGPRPRQILQGIVEGVACCENGSGARAVQNDDPERPRNVLPNARAACRGFAVGLAGEPARPRVGLAKLYLDKQSVQARHNAASRDKSVLTASYACYSGSNHILPNRV
jgi:hypothetical protein